MTNVCDVIAQCLCTTVAVMQVGIVKLEYSMSVLPLCVCGDLTKSLHTVLLIATACYGDALGGPFLSLPLLSFNLFLPHPPSLPSPNPPPQIFCTEKSLRSTVRDGITKM